MASKDMIMNYFIRMAVALALGSAGMLLAPSHAEAADQGKVCSTLGKVHASRERALYPVEMQSIDGQLSTRRGDSCIMLEAGKHVLGLTAATESVTFPRRRTALGALKEVKLPIEIEAGHTYTLAAQLDDRYEGSWIPVIERVEVW
jgi:hypothetical protein